MLELLSYFYDSNHVVLEGIPDFFDSRFAFLKRGVLSPTIILNAFSTVVTGFCRFDFMISALPEIRRTWFSVAIGLQGLDSSASMSAAINCDSEEVTTFLAHLIVRCILYRIVFDGRSAIHRGQPLVLVRWTLEKRGVIKGGATQESGDWFMIDE